MMEEVFIPFTIQVSPMTKLALINFEKQPDTLYKALELQYFSGPPYGSGFRVLAYRKDDFVDVYDDEKLNLNPAEEISAAGKGKKHHLQVSMKQPYLEQNNGNIELGFEFQDVLERIIKLEIREKLNQPSKALNILAPIGSGSEQPAAFPMYFLYDFDFVRLKQSTINLSIDQQQLKIDPFPVPFHFNGWRRNFARYSMNSQIIDFFVSHQKVGLVELNPELIYQDKAAEYQFLAEASGLTLDRININLFPPVQLIFEPSLPMYLKNQSGIIKVKAAEKMGYITGEYDCQVHNDDLELTMSFSGGWTGQPETLLEKVIMGRRSLFARWPKQYTYQARINFSKQAVQSKWVNLTE